MSVESSYNRFVRSLEKFLAGYGFERNGGRVFRKYSPAGDVLVIDLQTSSWSDKSERRFFINTALVLSPAWEARRRRFGRPESDLPKTVHGIWRDRVGPVDWDGNPLTVTDDESADRLWELLRPQLAAAIAGMEPMLDRGRLRELAEGGSPLLYSRKVVRAWLLAENGSSAELDDLMRNEFSAEQRQSDAAKDIVAYATSRSGHPTG